MVIRVDEVQTAIPHLKWRVSGNRYIGTVDGRDIEDTSFAVKARLDLNAYRMDGWAYYGQADRELAGDTFEERMESLKEAIDEEADSARYEANNWLAVESGLRAKAEAHHPDVGSESDRVPVEDPRDPG